jgi:hypothetical protein
VALSSIATGVEESTTIPDDLEQQIHNTLESGLVEPGKTELTTALAQQPTDVQAEARRIYDEATLDGFQAAILAGGFVAMLGALVAFRLPRRKLEGDPVSGQSEPVAEVVRNSTMPGIHLEMQDLPPQTS